MDTTLVHRTYFSEAAFTPGSRLIGRRLAELTETIGLPVHAILRGARCSARIRTR
ncbi:MAG: hypothetical protein IRZ16_09020 [Myxococcaceae bacterium]|nr:hypothetical protein [Myxococcaceae bacterium]